MSTKCRHYSCTECPEKFIFQKSLKNWVRGFQTTLQKKGIPQLGATNEERASDAPTLRFKGQMKQKSLEITGLWSQSQNEHSRRGLVNKQKYHTFMYEVANLEVNSKGKREKSEIFKN